MVTQPRRPLPSQDRTTPEYRLTISVDGLDLTVDEAVDDGWVTLRQAADRSGINAATVRNWARKGRVASRLVERPDGVRRLVDIDEVTRHARDIGRLEEPTTAGTARTETAATDSALPEGHMLVPLDAWEKMLIQLGNLHEAGQQLAEARERAAKAETEASFLRERLGDLRSERDELRTERDELRQRETRPATTHDHEGQASTTPTWREMLRRLSRRW